MRKKKIAVLHAQVPFVFGGAELHIQNLVKQLKIRDFDAEMISIPFKWYPTNELFNSAVIWRLLDLSEANEQKIDLIIATRYPTYAVKHDNKILWLLHQYRSAYDLYDKKEWSGLKFVDGGEDARDKLIVIDKKTINECKRVYTNSQNVANRLKKYNGIVGEKLYHPPALAGKYCCENFEDYILSIGRLDAIKRVDLIIRALKFCDSKIKLKIAGIGPEQKNLKRLTAELDLEARVEFLGFVSDDDVINLYANSLGVCYPPVDEDYGYVTIEAFLSKKPLITTTDSGGPLEFVEDGINGFVTEPIAEEIGNSIQRLYKNKKICMEFGVQGFEKVKDISWDNVIDKLTETIRY